LAWVAPDADAQKQTRCRVTARSVMSQMNASSVRFAKITKYTTIAILPLSRLLQVGLGELK
jgi:hypothetical protein